MSKINFTLEKANGSEALELNYERVFAIGYAGRNMEKTMEHIKELEAKGYAFEAAGGSLELLVLGALGRRPRFFEVLDFHVVSRKPEDDKNAQAYVKVAVDGRIEITADEGDGPVNALDLALRKALRVFYPCLNMMRLKDLRCGW